MSHPFKELRQNSVAFSEPFSSTFTFFSTFNNLLEVEVAKIPAYPLVEA